jgi:hypothetical protein
MKRLFTLVLLLLLAPGCELRGGDTPIRKELEAARDRAVTAMVAGDLSAFQGAVSSNHYAKMHNAYASSYTKKLSGEDLTKLGTGMRKYFTDPTWTYLRAPVNGPTAALVYWRDKEPDALSKQEKFELLIVGFDNEGGQWKLDTISTVSYFRKDDGKTVTPETAELRENAPSGKIKPAPALLPVAELAGRYNLFCPGTPATLIVNGNRQKTITSVDGPLAGGLKRGKNTLRIELSDPKAAGGMLKCTVTIGGFGNDAVKLYELDTLDAPAVVDAEFVIDEAKLKAAKLK